MRLPLATLATLAVITMLAVGCVSTSKMSDDTWPKETVMTPGMVIEATNENGTVRITCKRGGNKRTYQWNGEKKTVKLRTRKSRWYGKLGLYLPTYKWPLTPASFSADEAILHGETVEDVMRYLAREPSMRYVYTSDGLVVGYGIFPAKNKISISVYQILIQGEKPQSLPGADDSAIKVMHEPL